MALLLLHIAAVFYGIVAFVGLIDLWWPRGTGDRTVTVGLILALFAHALALGGRTVELQTFPLTDLHDGLSLFGFVAALIAVGITLRSGVPQTAAFAGVLVALTVVLAVFIKPVAAEPAPGSGWLPVHIAFAFLGEAAFAVAGIVAVVYLIQERRLKSKRRRLTKTGTGLHKLPALEILDKVSLRLIQLGFPFMAVGLLTGLVYSKEVTGAYWNWGLLNTVSVVVWLLFALLLHFRMTIGWRGRKAALLTLMGVTATLGVLVGLGLAGMGAHAGGIS